eukprot:Clim_evm38s221 gene=Clim_evmTU38s221
MEQNKADSKGLQQGNPGDRLLNTYILDYLRKSGFSASANTFMQEATNFVEPLPVDAPQGFLYDQSTNKDSQQQQNQLQKARFLQEAQRLAQLQQAMSPTVALRSMVGNPLEATMINPQNQIRMMMIPAEQKGLEMDENANRMIQQLMRSQTQGVPLQSAQMAKHVGIDPNVFNATNAQQQQMMQMMQQQQLMQQARRGSVGKGMQGPQQLPQASQVGNLALQRQGSQMNQDQQNLREQQQQQLQQKQQQNPARKSQSVEDQNQQMLPTRQSLERKQSFQKGEIPNLRAMSSDEKASERSSELGKRSSGTSTGQQPADELGDAQMAQLLVTNSHLAQKVIQQRVRQGTISEGTINRLAMFASHGPQILQMLAKQKEFLEQQQQQHREEQEMKGTNSGMLQTTGLQTSSTSGANMSPSPQPTNMSNLAHLQHLQQQQNSLQQGMSPGQQMVILSLQQQQQLLQQQQQQQAIQQQQEQDVQQQQQKNQIHQFKAQDMMGNDSSAKPIRASLQNLPGGIQQDGQGVHPRSATLGDSDNRPQSSRSNNSGACSTNAHSSRRNSHAGQQNNVKNTTTAVNGANTMIDTNNPPPDCRGSDSALQANTRKRAAKPQVHHSKKPAEDTPRDQTPAVQCGLGGIDRTIEASHNADSINIEYEEILRIGDEDSSLQYGEFLDQLEGGWNCRIQHESLSLISVTGTHNSFTVLIVIDGRR